jgi:hypothetical protein
MVRIGRLLALALASSFAAHVHAFEVKSFRSQMAS